MVKDIVSIYLKFVCNFGNSTRRKSIKSPWFWHIQFNFNWKNGSFIITQANGTRQFFTSMLTTQGKFKLWNGIDARAPPIKRMKSFQFSWIKNGIQCFVVFAAILWWCSKLNPTNNPVEMTLNGIVINSELVNLPEKLCCVWAATRDSKQRKLNYLIDYRYGINLKIVRKTSHVFLLIFYWLVMLLLTLVLLPLYLELLLLLNHPSVLIMLLIFIACSVFISMQEA